MKFPEELRVKHGMFQSQPGEGGFFLIRVLKEEKRDVVPGMIIPAGHVPPPKKTELEFFVVASNGMGWDHVSVSLTTEKRTPTWEEMCYIKTLFFEPEEAVIQFHPPASQHVNNHPFCLHLWRCQDVAFPLPLPEMVGVMGKSIADFKKLQK